MPPRCSGSKKRSCRRKSSRCKWVKSKGCRRRRSSYKRSRSGKRKSRSHKRRKSKKGSKSSIVKAAKAILEATAPGKVASSYMPYDVPAGPALPPGAEWSESERRYLPPSPAGPAYMPYDVAAGPALAPDAEWSESMGRYLPAPLYPAAAGPNVRRKNLGARALAGRKSPVSMRDMDKAIREAAARGRFI